MASNFHKCQDQKPQEKNEELLQTEGIYKNMTPKGNT